VTDYDFVIELNAAVLPRSHQNISAKTEDYVKVQYVSGASAEIDKIRSGFDPAQLFLEDMKVGVP
jgi:U3 small nucleolar RNA-associated protein 22